MSMHSTIASTLEYKLFDTGYNAADDHVVAELFERIRKTLAPTTPFPEYELAIADIRRDLLNELAYYYVLLDPIRTADAVLEAIYETQRPAEQVER